MVHRSAVLAVVLLAPATSSGAPSVYPTGTTIYDPTRAWSGFTVLSPLGTEAAIVIDMNGNIVKRWDGYNNSAGGPARVLPGGSIVAAGGTRPPHQESLELVQRDFAGNVVWRFDRNEQVESRDGATIQALRQHHDWQRADFPAGYYSPGAEPAGAGSRTLILTHTSRIEPAVADVMLEDDRIIEVTWDGEVVWEWIASEHIDGLGFDAAARAAIKAAPGFNAARGGFDWLHVNSATYLGPNPWFDAGDARFEPSNIIVSSRQASVIAIIGRDGEIVWRLGPDFSASAELRGIRQIIGQHHAHLIPKGLPGEGNLLVFDNGGASGYGFTNPIALDGSGALVRPNSRVLEINPITLALVWSYVAPGQFFASNISGAQRLPNGNTLITEGTTGRVFEVTNDGTIVWEYINALFTRGPGPRPSNAVYRAYRLPYAWIPQLERPSETAVTPPALGDFVLPANLVAEPASP
ncbi:MAG TPA: aryl-sulfate sulfotransferase [Gammaproteobacteria bacterium]